MAEECPLPRENGKAAAVVLRGHEEISPFWCFRQHLICTPFRRAQPRTKSLGTLTRNCSLSCLFLLSPIWLVEESKNEASTLHSSTPWTFREKRWAMGTLVRMGDLVHAIQSWYLMQTLNASFFRYDLLQFRIERWVFKSTISLNK